MMIYLKENTRKFWDSDIPYDPKLHEKKYLFKEQKMDSLIAQYKKEKEDIDKRIWIFFESTILRSLTLFLATYMECRMEDLFFEHS
jgi:hypothetical protein